MSNSKRVKYNPEYDTTLTQTQAKSGAFRPDVVKSVQNFSKIANGAFRVPSNLTQEGFSSGYHESFVTTDMTEKLSQAHKSGNNARLPQAHSGFWKGQSGSSFQVANLKPLMEAGDGARTDTARTILSGPNGTVAGHSGSNINTTNQSQAHDLLRIQSIRVLQDKKMTPEAIGVIASATTVFSMAPGEKAKYAKGINKLKSKAALKSWEKDRNEAKRRTNQFYDDLSKSDQSLVDKHMDLFVKDLGDSSRKRNRATSPIRDIGTQKGSSISGGGYDKNQKHYGLPEIDLPKGNVRDKTLYATQSFRINRRGKKKGY